MFRGHAYLAGRGTCGVILLWDRGNLRGLVMRRAAKSNVVSGPCLPGRPPYGPAILCRTERKTFEDLLCEGGKKQPRFLAMLTGPAAERRGDSVWDRTE